MGTVLLAVLSVLASGSTLAKNEFNCSLVAITECTAPHFTAPPSAITFAPPVTSGYEGLTGDDNPSLGGK